MQARGAIHISAYNTYLLYCHPDAPNVRAQVASLSTPIQRSQTIRTASHQMINAVCASIIADLLAHPDVTTYHVRLALFGIQSELDREFFLYDKMNERMIILYGMNCPLAATVTYLNTLLLQLNALVVTENSQHLWQELADWFAGKYHVVAKTDRIYRKRPLVGYPFIDGNDRLFWLITGVKQLAFIMPYYQMSQVIKQKINANAALVPVSLFKPSAPPLTESELSETDEDAARPEFECPLTLRTMKVAAICVLDGCSYEYDVLFQTLKNFGRTPTNITVAPEDIAQVIRPNIFLQNAIDCYRAGKAEDYCCPITKNQMKNAVFCLLDNCSYDQNAIEDYLKVHGKTPGGVRLPPGVSIHEILKPNITLRAAIGLRAESQEQPNSRLMH